MNLSQHLEKRRTELEAHLDRLLPPENVFPETLHKAMRYSVFAGGKRIRPILCIESAAAVTDDLAGIEDPACALEFIHTYSLIHDDLPALDNDDLRRGKPTCHKVFGEAVAILAGDALLTLAFEVLTKMARLTPEQKLGIIAELVRAAGTPGGMVGGQVADLEAEGQPATPERVNYIHRAKTGALIRAAVRTGALYAGADDDTLARLSRFGEHLGLAFQIVDDLLDVQSSPAQLGKPTGKDAALQKATYPAVYGIARSQAAAHELIAQACAELAPLGTRARTLEEIARYLLTRPR